MIKYYIIFPGGDKTKLSILELDSINDYELNDYSVASRKNFDNLKNAIDYAKELAKKHNLILESKDREIKKEFDYLD